MLVCITQTAQMQYNWNLYSCVLIECRNVPRYCLKNSEQGYMYSQNYTNHFTFPADTHPVLGRDKGGLRF